MLFTSARACRFFPDVSICKCRVVLLKAVANIWDEFRSVQRCPKILRSFRKLGMRLPINGSCDDDLSVNVVPRAELNVGRCQRETEGDTPDDEVEPACDNDAAIEFVAGPAPDDPSLTVPLSSSA
jgi:hypothetical protein